MISEYTVVASIEADGLAQLVNTHIQGGWQPWGSMAIVPYYEHVNGYVLSPKFTQPMVKIYD